VLGTEAEWVTGQEDPASKPRGPGFEAPGAVQQAIFSFQWQYAKPVAIWKISGNMGISTANMGYIPAKSGANMDYHPNKPGFFFAPATALLPCPGTAV